MLVNFFRNMRIRAEQSVPSTRVHVRVRTRRFANITENFTNKNGECEQRKSTKIFVRTKNIAFATRLVFAQS